MVCVGPTLKLGNYYDPALNSDYGGEYFSLVKNRLKQLDVRDAENELVAPWKFRDALKPGTLILANCSLHCFVMEETSGDNIGKDRKVCKSISSCSLDLKISQDVSTQRS